MMNMNFDMSEQTPLLSPENLPLDLEKFGVVAEAELVMPGVYEATLLNPTNHVGVGAYLVLSDTANISAAAKKYGKIVPNHPELLVYSEDGHGNTCYIINYELSRYRVLHHLPLPADAEIRSTAAIGSEMYPEYFGRYPVPYLTPWGYTTRNKVIANGVYWLETEQFQRGLAVADPKSTDLSKETQKLAEPFDGDLVQENQQEPGYLFFKETDSSVPLYELIFLSHSVYPDCSINQAALMNAIYQYHPEYAALQFISLTAQVGTEFLDF